MGIFLSKKKLCQKTDFGQITPHFVFFLLRVHAINELEGPPDDHDSIKKCIWAHLIVTMERNDKNEKIRSVKKAHKLLHQSYNNFVMSNFPIFVSFRHVNSYKVVVFCGPTLRG